MGRRTEQTFFQSRHADGGREKMINIINHQRNANQTHSEILPHTYNGYHQKEHK